MASFNFFVYFPFRYQALLIKPEMLYADLIKIVFNHFHINLNDENLFLLQIFDLRYKGYVEFDDGYINHLRKRLPRTSIENLYGRIVCRQQAYLLSRQSYFSMGNRLTFPNCLNSDLGAPMYSPPPYVIIWLDEYFALPNNFRSMKRYLFEATLVEGPICDAWPLDTDIDNLIQNNHEADFDWSKGHLKMFTDIDLCRDYITSQQNNLILLITSNRNGQIILPSIYDRILNTYVLRDSWYDFEWGVEYIESLQMFDDDLCMLTRVIRDLARYFVDRASQLEPMYAIQYFNWAKKLYLEVDREPTKRSVRRCGTILNYIDNQLTHLENIVEPLNQDYDDE
jgi:hypothetical protein